MPERNWPSWSTELRTSAVEIERVVETSASAKYDQYLARRRGAGHDGACRPCRPCHPRSPPAASCIAVPAATTTSIRVAGASTRCCASMARSFHVSTFTPFAITAPESLRACGGTLCVSSSCQQYVSRPTGSRCECITGNPPARALCRDLEQEGLSRRTRP
jgi:hypothetical protein